MGRLRRTKKIGKIALSGEAREVIVSRMTTLLVAAIFLTFTAMLAKAFLNESDYFKLRSVYVKTSFLDPKAAASISERVFDTYKSRSVFGIDLKRIADNIQNKYGDVRDVTVNILPPDSLVISLKLRRPVALLNSGKLYPVDEDGVILPGGSRVEALGDLPVINGLDIRGMNSRFARRNLALALELLGEIRLARELSGFGVASINVYDPRNMSFCLKNGVEVRVGQENFRDRLDLLSKALRDPRLVLDNVKYIDVRFKDIIIGPK